MFSESMEKILCFIINKDKLLLLLGNEEDPQFHKSFWYVVTGGCEQHDKTLEESVRREVKEETNLNIEKIIDLNWIFEYESLGNNCIEHAFIAFTNENNIKLNEENIDYKWCDIDDFINLIHWYYDKEELKSKLKKYLHINKE